MLENWLPILIFLVLITGFAVTSLIMSWVLGVRNPTPEKLTPYESGMKPIGTARDRFSIQFYIVAMLFLLFDIEVIFLGSSAEFVGKTVFHRRLRRPRCSPSLKASLASSAAAPALTLGCAPRCRLVWAMGNGASGGGSGHRV